MKFLCLDGKMLAADQPIFTANNRGFRYGDGLFETAKLFQGRLLLEEYHFERLFFGIKLLQLDAESLNREIIIQQILELSKQNNCSHLARVRIAVYRNEELKASYLIEVFPLENTTNALNEKGWVIGLHPYVRKSMDTYSNLKSANYLPYIVADIFSKEKGWDECMVLNAESNICDGSKTNIFLVKQNEIYTPSLNQGCVNGVKRRLVIEELKKMGLVVHQTEISEERLLQADEVFLTNAIQDLRWVQCFGKKQYSSSFTREFYQKTFSTIYSPTC